MNTDQKNRLANLLESFDKLPADEPARLAGEKAAEFLTELDVSDPREAVAETAYYLSVLVYRLVESTDILGIGLLDGTAFLQLVESMSYGAALSVRDLLPEAEKTDVTE